MIVGAWATTTKFTHTHSPSLLHLAVFFSFVHAASAESEGQCQPYEGVEGAENTHEAEPVEGENMLWLLGAFTSIIGSVLQNAGVNIQKYSHMKENLLPPSKRRGYIKQGWWIMGFFMVLFGSLGDFVALGLAPQSIVAPVGSATLIWNLGFAKWGLKEEIGRRDLLGVGMILLGCICAVVTGSHCTPNVNMNVLIFLWGQTHFLVYISICGCLTIGLYIWLRLPIQWHRNRLEELLDEAEEILLEMTEVENKSLLEKIDEEEEKSDEHSKSLSNHRFGDVPPSGLASPLNWEIQAIEVPKEKSQSEKKEMEESPSNNQERAILQDRGTAAEIERPESRESAEDRLSIPPVQVPVNDPREAGEPRCRRGGSPQTGRSPSHSYNSTEPRCIRTDVREVGIPQPPPVPRQRSAESAGVTRGKEERERLKHSGLIPNDLKAQILAAEEAYLPYEKYHPFLFCIISGLFGSFSMVFAKGVAELFARWFEGDPQYTNWLLYVFFICMLYCIVSQLHFLALGLKYFDSMYIVPVFQCCMILFSVLGGMMFYQEYRDFTATNWILFPLGVLVTVGGVITLSFRKMDQYKDKYTEYMHTPTLEMQQLDLDTRPDGDASSVSSRQTPDLRQRSATPDLAEAMMSGSERLFSTPSRNSRRRSLSGSFGRSRAVQKRIEMSRRRGASMTSPEYHAPETAPTFGEILAQAGVPLPSTFGGYTEIPLDILSAVTEIPIRFAEKALRKKLAQKKHEGAPEEEQQAIRKSIRTVHSELGPNSLYADSPVFSPDAELENEFDEKFQSMGAQEMKNKSAEFHHAISLFTTTDRQMATGRPKGTSVIVAPGISETDPRDHYETAPPGMDIQAELSPTALSQLSANFSSSDVGVDSDQQAALDALAAQLTDSEEYQDGMGQQTQLRIHIPANEDPPRPGTDI